MVSSQAMTRDGRGITSLKIYVCALEYHCIPTYRHYVKVSNFKPLINLPYTKRLELHHNQIAVVSVLKHYHGDPLKFLSQFRDNCSHYNYLRYARCTFIP